MIELRAKPVHLAALIEPGGRVSPLCADPPRPLSVRYEVWTPVPRLVTCERCLAHPKFAERAARAAEAPK